MDGATGLALHSSTFTPKGVDARWLAGLFLVAHGVLHVVIWTMPTPADAPFEAHHSPVFGNIRVASIVLACCGVVLDAAGVGVLTHSGWWPQAAIVGAAGSIVLLCLR